MTRDGGGGEAEGATEAADEAGFVFARELVLPHAEDAPAERAEGAGDEEVAGAVSGDLFWPEGGVGFGRGGVERAAVPEAAIDEGGSLLSTTIAGCCFRRS